MDRQFRKADVIPLVAQARSSQRAYWRGWLHGYAIGVVTLAVARLFIHLIALLD